MIGVFNALDGVRNRGEKYKIERVHDGGNGLLRTGARGKRKEERRRDGG